MFKPCKKCNVMLNEQNAAKSSNGFRRICRPCRSKQVVEYGKNNREKRRAYANQYARKVGRVKQYPCIGCNTLCYKKNAQAFCSDKCRFMFYVTITKECWLWNGSKNRRGYGKFCFEGNLSHTAHRASYKLFKGEIKDDLLVCHTCDNPSCVNPDHLWLGTTQENKKDQIYKGRGGVKLNDKNVIEIRKLYDNEIGSNTIAKLFNVTCGTISSIVKRRIWKHI